MEVSVVIPAYRATSEIMNVLDGIPDDVTRIYVVDDFCPDGIGDFVEKEANDNRITIIRHKKNKGVGGAVITGMKQALKDGADIVIKIDADGQMLPKLIPCFIKPIKNGEADYVKGNRFYDPSLLSGIPMLRLIGNAGLSFLTKLSSGYWKIFDPTNGYFAIHTKVLKLIPLHKVSNRYFFESDMLFRLNLIRAKVVDLPMRAVYSGEASNLSEFPQFFQFLVGNIRNTFKRFFYNYLLRDFSIATVELLIGVPLFVFGCVYGYMNWNFEGPAATAGTVMLSGLSIIVGLQLLLSFVNYDIQSTPDSVIHNNINNIAHAVNDISSKS